MDDKKQKVFTNGEESKKSGSKTQAEIGNLIMTETPTPKPKPIYLRLIPWLAVLMFAICLLVACEPFVANYRAIKALEAKGAEVTLEAPDWMPVYIRNKLSEEQTYFVYKVVGANVINDKLGDAEMKLLIRFTHLRSLDLQGTHVGNASLKYLSNLTNLEWLNLTSTQVSDDGLKHLRGLTKLERLHLSDTQVNDDGLRHLSGLTKLKNLHLTGTQVSDAGLQHLSGLTKLKKLHLYKTKVSKEGVKKLQKALPKCYIIWTVRHIRQLSSLLSPALPCRTGV